MKVISVTICNQTIQIRKLRELVTDRRPGMLWFMGKQRVGHDSATELN